MIQSQGVECGDPHHIQVSSRAYLIAFEIVNAALEALLDHLHPDIHKQIRIVKDMVAGAVLLVVIGAVVVGGVLLAVTVFGRG